ncbi:Exodeoxyribonuclease 1 [Spathaspora sp. JA1]|nr:Exodeoxyribonuclease 1 [Spathaspora sp. JA1]
MGVTGLLPNLKEIQQAGTLERYRGTTLAIDTYGWLHRSVVSCAHELCMDIPTKKYINSILKKIEMLQHFGVTPYFVFDGASLPTKSETNLERKLKRQQARQQAETYMKQGNSKLAFKEFMKAASVTHAMAKSIMVELDNLGIKYVVAPYEADPQMVYLEKLGIVDGILSEDSDLLVFGCRRLITKLKDDGTCVEINRDDFVKVRSIPYLGSYTAEQIRLVAMLSGCDYTKGVGGIGIKSAFTLVRKYNNLQKITLALQSEGKQIPQDFKYQIDCANLAFQYQKVFHPESQKLMTLNEYPERHDLDMEVVELCCGKSLDNETYIRLCNGEINPNTHELLVSREQSLASLKSNSMTLKPAPSDAVATTANRSRSDIPKRSIIDMLSPTTPEKRPFKRPNVVYKTHDMKLSPTIKKIHKLTSSSPAEGISSKFFIKSTPEFDSSMLSDSSEVPDNSSPLKVNTATEEDVVTDEDIKDNEYYESSINSKGFELSDDDGEEIEESPVKTTTTTEEYVTRFKASLRERFMCDSTYAASTILKPHDINVPTKGPPVKATTTSTTTTIDIRQFAFKR